jgi:hypothetical protein
MQIPNRIDPKSGDQMPQVAHLMVLYRACVKRKHPWSQEMARRYEQELRQLGVSLGLN